MRNVSDKSCREILKHFTFRNFFTEDRAVYETVEKYCRACDFTDDIMAHAHRMLDN